MPRGTIKVAPGDVLERLKGCDVEARTLNGNCIRGVLKASTSEWLTIERTTTCRLMLVRVAALASLVDERGPDLHLRGAIDADDARRGRRE